MAGFDDAGVFFSDNFAADDHSDDGKINRIQIKNKFKEFLKLFHEGNLNYKYR